MAYTAQITRANPTCILFLIDQSGSMADISGGGEVDKKKADVVADATNRLLHTLVLRCTKGEGVRDYFHVGVIGYGKNVAFALGGPLSGRGLVPLSEIANNPLAVESRTKKVSDGAGGLVDDTVKFPVWFKPVADGATPMCSALQQAIQVVSDFIDQVPGCYPPIVLNITDGESSDGVPEDAAAKLRAVASGDGNVLLFNLHLSSSRAKPLQFPDNESSVSDQYAQMLFRMSSVLPPYAQDAARSNGIQGVSEASRGLIFNADIVSVAQFLDIGTKVSTQR